MFELLRITLLSGLLLLAPPLTATEVQHQYQGLTINANLELANGKSLADGVILIVHGMQAHNRMEIIEASQQALRSQGLSSLAINLGLGIDNRRGFYDCDWPHRHGFIEAANEINAWIEWLTEQGVGPVSLIGHSLGGTQAAFFLDRYRNTPVTRVILLAPASGSYERIKNDHRARYQEEIDSTLSQAHRLVDAGKGEQLMDDIDFFFCPVTRISANTFYQYYRADSAFTRMPDYLRGLRIPALIIAASHDERQPDVIRRLSPVADGDRVRLVVIENSGHFFRDLNIDEAIEHAVKFIEDAS